VIEQEKAMLLIRFLEVKRLKTVPSSHLHSISKMVGIQGVYRSKQNKAANRSKLNSTANKVTFRSAYNKLSDAEKEALDAEIKNLLETFHKMLNAAKKPKTVESRRQMMKPS
jgi:hypothetical protein